MLSKTKIDQIFSVLSQDNPHPETELQFTNNFTLLVAVVLSAQATDIGVNKATKDLFAKYDTAQGVVDLGEERLKQYIKTIGLFNMKAKNIIALSEKLCRDYNGEVPANLEELQNLPGVGRKTANVVMNCAFGEPTMAVDTHVHRLANRLGLSRGKTPLVVEQDLLKKIPAKWLQHAHHWLILHGRYVCKARKPDCANCIINQYCEKRNV